MTTSDAVARPILELVDLSVVYGGRETGIRALDGVSIAFAAGQCHAIVGESGSGKSTLAHAIMGLLQPTAGSVLLDGKSVGLSRPASFKKDIQLVQQNPSSALNPQRSIGNSIRLPLEVNRAGSSRERRARVDRLLEEVGLDPEFGRRRPGQLSGGQKQRAAIARALASEPRVIIFDEPTSALDVLVQSRVLRLLKRLQAERELTYLFITHDLGVVRAMAQHVSVFKQGRLVESATTAHFFENPIDPYSHALIRAVPVVSEAELALRDALAGDLS